MSTLLTKCKYFIKRNIGDTFNRDVLVLLVVSIVIGSLLANSLAYAANTYFAKTLSNLVGDYGEYDLVVNVREELKEEAAAQIEKIISDALPGAKMKEGPTLAGKTNFLIALPDEYKTKQIYEDLGKIFGSIPGGGGVSVMTEPRLTLRGVPDGAKSMLMERIGALDGVRFVFRDGGSIGVILTSLDKVTPVTNEIKNILNQYQVIEVAFPVGGEPANPIRLGEAIAKDMEEQLKVQYAQNVSVDGKNDDMTYLVSTMMELKRFLSAYASQVTITPAGGVKLTRGDIIAFPGVATAPLVSGKAPERGNVLVEITAVRSDGVAEGVVTQGDASQLTPAQGYKLINGVVGPPAGTATWRSPRQELAGALTETSKLVGQIPGFAQDTQNMSNIALTALNNYSGSLTAIEQTLDGLQAAGATIQAATSGLASLDTSGIQSQLESSSRAIGGLINTMQVVRLISPDAAASVSNLAAAQRNLDNLRATLGTLDNVAADARRAKTAIDGIVTSGQTTVAALRTFDANGARQSLADVNNRLAQVQQLNVPLITAQLQYLAQAAPNLKDEEISHSVKLLDRFIDGQVIPGQRIQILTTANISIDAVTPIVHEAVGHSNVSLYSSALGIIEPNPRSEVMMIMQQVKAVLAGMAAIIATILFLVLDHTAIMAAIRRKRLAAKVEATGWRKVVRRFTLTFTAPERQYGMAVGAVLLTAMFILSGGGIPYLPWIGVPALGALLGLIVANNAEKISPIATEEVMAGEALGLSFDEIMREIVIPSGRPGLMQKLNRRKLKFK
ncbi:hypothetical protein TcarDRAFT_0096 [Thermosinus carboxydivorans Nor1]|uniref:Uncharacterized protein n=1 Tax=Thermosinus carboxydivorans Nor1 TaxID=401526 RepID=A1HU30_9FIRM|nr:hypothetical protein [Thermosinus carboxydivorans]EAX46470.1 hypothetical protein TcarDRAFT_0096 [Thermosinus carboxydivorans Nor1]